MKMGHFNRVTCWLHFEKASVAQKIITFYGSIWDTRLNRYIEKHCQQINDALATYPSNHCYFTLFPEPNPIETPYASQEEEDKAWEEMAEFNKESTTYPEGTISCALMQDKGREISGVQRFLTINVEDMTEDGLLAAIRYLEEQADLFKNYITEGPGYIPTGVKITWQIDLKKERPEYFATNKLWLSGKYDLFFTEKILQFDEKSHRLMFVPTGKMKAEKFMSDFYAEAFYILYWNHLDILRDSDFTYTEKDKNKRRKKRYELLKKEFELYYRGVHAPGEKPFQYKGNQRVEVTYRKAVDDFFEDNEEYKQERNRSRTSFLNHETKRVQEKYAKKMVSYYEINAKKGYIPLSSRDTIILPDSMKRMRLIQPELSIPGYKLSQYCFFLTYFYGDTFLYNPLHNIKRIIHEEDTKMLLSGQISDSLKNNWIENYILIPEEWDETEIYADVYKRENETKNILSLAIMPTLKCNCSCPYCFENKRHEEIPEEVEDAIIDWIFKQLPQYKGLAVDWFGGEPLLQKDKILRMSKRLIHICNALHLPYSAALTTNGVALENHDDMKMLFDCHIDNVQITFDGAKAAHNKVKAGTYDKLITNINNYIEKRKLFHLKPLRIRINVSDANYDTIEDLLTDFLRNGFQKHIVVFYRWVYSNSASHWKEFSEHQKGKHPYVGIYRLQMLAIMMGFKVDNQYEKFHLRFSHCEADLHGFYTIDPQGNIYQCVHEYNPQFSIGNVREGVTKQEEYDNFREVTGLNDEVCRACKWLPMCHGGCRRYRINHESRLCIDEKQDMELYLDMLYSQIIYE